MTSTRKLITIDCRAAWSEHQGLGEVRGEPCSHLWTRPKASLFTLAGSIRQSYRVFKRPPFNIRSVFLIQIVGVKLFWCHQGFGASTGPRPHLGDFPASLPLCRLHCSSSFCQVSPVFKTLSFYCSSSPLGLLAFYALFFINPTKTFKYKERQWMMGVFLRSMMMMIQRWFEDGWSKPASKWQNNDEKIVQDCDHPPLLCHLCRLLGGRFPFQYF